MSEAPGPLPSDRLVWARQITAAPHGHVLTNANVWSPDGRWIVYDVRSDVAGSVFDGTRIEAVNVQSGEIKVVYESKNGAKCGVATFSPAQHKIAFILGPEHPTSDWSYSACHRQGVIVDFARPGLAVPMDARDLSPPFTAGALRGGSHVHIFSSDGQWISFTYEDHILATADRSGAAPCDVNQRNIGISVASQPVIVSRNHPRNHNGSHFTVLVTQTHNAPRPGSDEIQRAFEEGWVGTQGYIKPDGTWQRRALAFQGEVISESGQPVCEVYIVDIPEEFQPGAGPLQGTINTRPAPPLGTVQRRLTHTTTRKHPGISGPRHWLRSSPDGSRIAFLMKDDAGIVQLWTISPNGGAMTQLTKSPWPIESAFTWNPDGKSIACVIDRSLFLIDANSGQLTRLTPPADAATAPRPEACVFSPDGRYIAYVRPIATAGDRYNQIFVAHTDQSLSENGVKSV